jgi:hypothetical protein
MWPLLATPIQPIQKQFEKLLWPAVVEQFTPKKEKNYFDHKKLN